MSMHSRMIYAIPGTVAQIAGATQWSIVSPSPTLAILSGVTFVSTV